MTNSWFPSGKEVRDGWRLDIVSLLAVIGESAMADHSQTMTSSWMCMLPRIIPAPQVLLKSSRPSRMPQVNAAVVGVHNGVYVQSLNFFPNIIHPIENLKPFEFKVFVIKHRNASPPVVTPPTPANKQRQVSASSSIETSHLESGTTLQPRRRDTLRARITHRGTNVDDKKPHVPARFWSPLNCLSLISFFLTIGLFIWAILTHDGTACVALFTISLASSIVGYASYWSPALMNRNNNSKVPLGDVVIRTREGAFIVVRCDEEVARELYNGTEECQYYVDTDPYRVLVGIGTCLLMISVVLLGNCDFQMQISIGASYIVLNGAYWGVALMNKRRFWDLSSYEWTDVTPESAQGAYLEQDANDVEGRPSFTRTLWYAIRETKKIGWVKTSGAAPTTAKWAKWLEKAEDAAIRGDWRWDAVRQKDATVGESDSVPQAEAAFKDTATEHAPAVQVPMQDRIDTE
ncbi:uncharacterized protein EAF01_005068 [Botrytis porri]|uniref:Uncharacterized protein n=1 Tax=Botrytis porri TaxID=87229 RepID=A0A4Z1KXL3_9HELO|nr:uncharacterized protein EAF01_005068 [Botrytis porri]KAF7907482.1 hypothetical protein EAF01_005068 [Botrytis porri]TGO89252.1 hypothetical protein BPOR_0118g00150 [Botrytis porri]